jgi:hypothetical protein
MNTSYDQFISKKIKVFEDAGFDVNETDLNKYLFPFQKHIVKLALKKGRYALFEDCGLGKTIQQLEWARQVNIYTNKPVLILCPLAVAGQTIQEGIKFGIEVIKYNGGTAPIQIINYEQLDNIDASIFSGIVLDESSILKNFEGAYRNQIIELFKYTPFKLACTATPSPNDPMELGNHSEFLNIMGRSEMLAMYFVHDGGETAKWRIKRHAEHVFWNWVSSWAVMLSNPKDIGFEMKGFNLPKLNYIQKEIKTPVKESLLFNDVSVSAIEFNSVLRITMINRIEVAAEIVKSSNENFIIWIKQNAEGDGFKKLLPEAIEVRGNDTPEYKEEKLLGFANNEFRVLITKQKIAMYGMNYQNCHNQVFASLDFSFEALYQAIRRSYRFGQKHEVNIYLITTDNMQNVIHAIERKQHQFNNMQKIMIKQYAN